MFGLGPTELFLIAPLIIGGIVMAAKRRSLVAVGVTVMILGVIVAYAGHIGASQFETSGGQLLLMSSDNQSMYGGLALARGVGIIMLLAGIAIFSYGLVRMNSQNMQQVLANQQNINNPISPLNQNVSQTKFCTECGSQNPLGSRFCESCGKQIG